MSVRYVQRLQGKEGWGRVWTAVAPVQEQQQGEMGPSQHALREQLARRPASMLLRCCSSSIMQGSNPLQAHVHAELAVQSSPQAMADGAIWPPWMSAPK